jgi:hypothetical protein
VGGLRVERFLNSGRTLQRLLDWANGVPDAEVLTLLLY